MKNCCGKDCESCTVREAEQCPGCRHIADFGECEIVSCCKDKGHESCSTCTQQTWCPTVQKSISMPKYRREKADAEAEISSGNRKNTGIMVKWCVPLFWILLILESAGVIDSFFEDAPTILIVLNSITILLYLLEAFCLYKMSSVTDRYGKAALFTMLIAVFSCIPRFLSSENIAPFLITLIALPGAIFSYHAVYYMLITLIALPSTIFSCLAVYQTYKAHSDALSNVDGELAEMWEKLWKWTIYVLVGMFLVVLTSALLGFLGQLLLLVVMIAMAICGVLKLVYLHRMIEIYRWYLEENTSDR